MNSAEENAQSTHLETTQETATRTKKIAIIIGAIVLVAGAIAGSIYLLTHQNSEETTIVSVADATDGYLTLQEGKNKITTGGTYTFKGSINNGKITVDTTDAVTIILDNVSITNQEGAAIKCQEGSNVTIKLIGENSLASTDKGTSTDDPSNVISSDGTLTLTGNGSAKLTGNGKGIKAETSLELSSGTYQIATADDGIHTNGDLKIIDGSYTIKTDDDAIHAEGLLQIDGGTFELTAHEGLEATYIKINNGDIAIDATDDGINAANKSTAYSVAVEINGGNITVNMGQGDTDAIDSNGNIIINGGTITITAQSPFDYDGTAEYNGGTLIVNGETTTTITNQFMGGGMMGGGMMGGGQAQAQAQAGQAPASQAQGDQVPDNRTPQSRTTRTAR